MCSLISYGRLTNSGRGTVPVFPSLIVLMVCGRKATFNLNSLTHSELTSCVKVEMAVLGSTSLTVLMVSVDVKQH